MKKLEVLVLFSFSVLISAVLIQNASAGSGTRIYLDAPPSVLYVGQTVTFSGTLVTSGGSPLQGATIYIKDDDLGPDDLITSGITNKYGEFRVSTTVKNWDEWGGASDIYARFEGVGGYEESKSQIYEVSVYQKVKPQSNVYSTNSLNYGSTVKKSNSYNSQLSNYGYKPTKITLDTIRTNVYSGQKVTFSGYVTSGGKPLQNAEVQIKDEDFLDLDDTLVTTVRDSKGRFSATWSVRDVDSSDRKLTSLLLTLVDPTFSIVPTANKLLNEMEKDTVEIYAEFPGSNTYQKSNTCTVRYSGGSSYTSCTNNVLVIQDQSSSIEDRIVSLALNQVIPGNGITSHESDLLYSALSSGKISENDLNKILAKALASELGVSSNTHTVEQMLSMLEN